MNNHLAKVIHWVLKNKEYFNPLKGPNNSLRIKMFAELQLTLLILNRYKCILSDNSVKEVETLAEYSCKILNSPRYYEQILAHPEYFRLYGASAIYYLDYGHSNILIESLKKVSVFTKYNECELQNYSKMDLEHLLAMTGKYINNNENNGCRKFLQTSILNSNLDVAFFSRLDEYSFTHSIFYLTDFGLNRNISKELYTKIEYIILTLGCKNDFIKDMDLLGEYIMCLCFLHSKKTYLKKFYEDLILNQCKDGSFCGPNRDGLIKNCRGLRGIYKHHRKIVLDNYHTTFVGVMAITLYLINSNE